MDWFKKGTWVRVARNNIDYVREPIGTIFQIYEAFSLNEKNPICYPKCKRGYYKSEIEQLTKVSARFYGKDLKND